jgi:hypothetical protein
MSSKSAVRLEKKLENDGTLRLSQRDAMGLFNHRARKLVGMSGGQALKRIRSGKCGKKIAWTELTLFSTLLR